MCRREIDLRKRGRCWYCVFGVIYCPRAQQSAAQSSLSLAGKQHICVWSAPLCPKITAACAWMGNMAKKFEHCGAREWYMSVKPFALAVEKRENLTMLMPNLWLSLHCAPVASKGGCFPEIMLARPENSKMHTAPRKEAHLWFLSEKRGRSLHRAKHWLNNAWLIVERAFSFFLFLFPGPPDLRKRDLWSLQQSLKHFCCCSHRFWPFTWPWGSVQILKNYKKQE